MARVLLLGAGGLLGGALCTTLTRDHEVVRQSRSAGIGVDVVADPRDPRSVHDMVDRIEPDVIVNASALTNVDLCQYDPPAAYAANARALEYLAAAVAGSHAHMVQVSTDHFYSRPFPQTEDDADVLNMYAATKLMGELFALRHARSTVLRTNFAGRSTSMKRKSFSDWIVQSLRAHSRVRLARDVMFSPLSIGTLADCIARLIDRPAFGVYNLGSVGGTSKHGAGIAIARHLGLDTTLIECVDAADLGFSTPRPTDMTMDVSRFQRDCFPLPGTAGEIEKIASSHE